MDVGWIKKKGRGGGEREEKEKNNMYLNDIKRVLLSCLLLFSTSWSHPLPHSLSPLLPLLPP